MTEEPRWIELEEAYARRNEYAPDIRERIVEMMRKERIHRVRMAQIDRRNREEMRRIDRSAPRSFFRWITDYYRNRRGGRT